MLAHLNPAMDQRIPASRVPLIQERISCSFEEHHCLSFSEPLLAPLRREGLGEDIFNAWFPQDLEFTRRTVRKIYTLSFNQSLFPRGSQDGLEIFDPSTGKNTWYETYHPDRRSPYSTRACERLSNASNPEWYREEVPDFAMQEDTEEVDEYEDFVEDLPSGIQDIIITGEVGFLPFSPLLSVHRSLVQTCERQGEAWGYFSYIGRIRPWDGLVVFLRIPVRTALTPPFRSQPSSRIR
jgi:hypothetical protein